VTDRIHPRLKPWLSASEVNGFAVILSPGIIAGLFAATLITGLIFHYLIVEQGWKKICI